MGREFSIVPRNVPRVETRYRRIVTPIPAPESLPILETLRKFEPISMRGQPPILWDRAEDIQVSDRWGNMWLDWSSGVLVTNAGHGAAEVKQAIIDQVNSGLLHNYCFPSEERAQLLSVLAGLAPEGLTKVFLLTTGAEATENALKMARTCGIRKAGTKKIGFVGFERGFHGRTLGAQQAGGIPGQERVDRQRRSRHRADPVSRRVLDRRYSFQSVLRDPGKERYEAGARGRRHARDLPGSRTRLCPGRICQGAVRVVQGPRRLADL